MTAGPKPKTQLIAIAAPSGAGKTTLCQRLLKDFQRLVLSISTTTRAPRGQEKDGREYHFVSRGEFERQIQAGRFVEWAEVHGNYYGTSLDTLDRAFAAGKAVLLDIDVQGVASLRKIFGERAYTIFIAPPDLSTLEERLRSRGTDTAEAIARRMSNARLELEQARQFDKTLVNDDLESAYGELKSLVAERLGTDNG